MKDSILVIFDNDGVLVDSEGLACETHISVLRQIGHPIDYSEFCRRAIGTSSKDCLAMLESYWGRPLPDDYAETVRQAAEIRFRAALQPIRGMADLLAQSGLPRCVASSGLPERIALALEITGLAGYFGDRLFSAAAVARGKPAPDLFLYAARQMGIPPERCIVIEDSVPGIRAAKAAGMLALGFIAGCHCGTGYGDGLLAAGADRLVTDAAQLRRLLIGIERLVDSDALGIPGNGEAELGGIQQALRHALDIG